MNDWRQGQIMFVFLEWLHTQKGIDNEQSMRMADPFDVSDEEWEVYFKEFLNSYNK